MTNRPVVLKVALKLPLRECLDYLPPSGFPIDKIMPGVRLRVPFRRGVRIGVLMQTSSHRSKQSSCGGPSRRASSSGPALRCGPPCLALASSWWTKSTTVLINSRTDFLTQRAMSPSSAPRARTYRSFSVPPPLRWNRYSRHTTASCDSRIAPVRRVPLP
ncbi:MAG: hypothetical protein ACREYC_25390 [Gammaproteobacteria bacterium]